MSSPLTRLTLGRRTDQDQARSVMLGRLGIAEEKPRDVFSQPEPEPTAAPQALIREASAPQPAPEVVRAPAWVLPPANDPQPEPVAATPAFEIPSPPPPAIEAEPEEEDPFEAIRRQYRQPPSTLPGGLPLPSSLPPIPMAPFKMAPVGERRRKAGELSIARKAIWSLSTLTALIIGWALLKGDESNPIVQVFGMLLP